MIGIPNVVDMPVGYTWCARYLVAAQLQTIRKCSPSKIYKQHVVERRRTGKDAYMTENIKATRRTILLGAATLSGMALLAPREANAGVVTQANAKYQDKPKGPAHCSQCNYFIPGANATANGTCKQVAGVISPNGWCQFYAKKAGAK